MSNPMSVPEAMAEALRRYTRFHCAETAPGYQNLQSTKPLTEAWTGLGYASDYRAALSARYMEPVFPDHDYKGHDQWFRLTKRGANIVQAWLNAGLDYRNVEAGEELPWPLAERSK